MVARNGIRNGSVITRGCERHNWTKCNSSWLGEAEWVLEEEVNSGGIGCEDLEALAALNPLEAGLDVELVLSDWPVLAPCRVVFQTELRVRWWILSLKEELIGLLVTVSVVLSGVGITSVDTLHWGIINTVAVVIWGVWQVDHEIGVGWVGLVLGVQVVEALVITSELSFHTAEVHIVLQFVTILETSILVVFDATAVDQPPVLDWVVDVTGVVLRPGPVGDDGWV